MEHVNWKKTNTLLLSYIITMGWSPFQQEVPCQILVLYLPFKYAEIAIRCFPLPRNIAMSATSTNKNWGYIDHKYEGFSHQQGLHQCGFVLPLDQQEQGENKKHDRVSAPM